MNIAISRRLQHARRVKLCRFGWSHGFCWAGTIVRAGEADTDEVMIRFVASLTCKRVSLVTSPAGMLYRAAKCLDFGSACDDASDGRRAGCAAATSIS